MSQLLSAAKLPPETSESFGNSLAALRVKRLICHHDLLILRDDNTVECRWCGQEWK